jgi:hypothetical protein
VLARTAGSQSDTTFAVGARTEATATILAACREPDGMSGIKEDHCDRCGEYGPGRHRMMIHTMTLRL